MNLGILKLSHYWQCGHMIGKPNFGVSLFSKLCRKILCWFGISLCFPNFPNPTFSRTISCSIMAPSFDAKSTYSCRSTKNRLCDVYSGRDAQSLPLLYISCYVVSFMFLCEYFQFFSRPAIEWVFQFFTFSSFIWIDRVWLQLIDWNWEGVRIEQIDSTLLLLVALLNHRK